MLWIYDLPTSLRCLLIVSVFLAVSYFFWIEDVRFHVLLLSILPTNDLP